MAFEPPSKSFFPCLEEQCIFNRWVVLLDDWNLESPKAWEPPFILSHFSLLQPKIAVFLSRHLIESLSHMLNLFIRSLSSHTIGVLLRVYFSFFFNYNLDKLRIFQIKFWFNSSLLNLFFFLRLTISSKGKLGHTINILLGNILS